MTDQRRDIGQFIREQRNLAELSVRRLADLAGVSNPYLSQIERGLRKPSAEILQQLAKALQVSAETMYVQAGMLDADSVRPPAGLATAIRSAPELNEAQRKALLGVYHSFVGPGRAGPGRAGDGPATPAKPGTPATPVVPEPERQTGRDDSGNSGSGGDSGGDSGSGNDGEIASGAGVADAGGERR